MIRIRTNRNTWRDVYASPDAGRLMRMEPDQSSPSYTANGVIFCRLAIRQAEGHRDESIWLLLDVTAMGSATSAVVLARFLEDDAREFARRAVGASERVIIKTPQDFEHDAAGAEGALANLAREAELPALAEKSDQAAPTSGRSWTTRLLTASLACNVLILAAIGWSLWNSTKALSGGKTVDLSEPAMNTIAGRVKTEVGSAIDPISKKIDNFKPPTLDAPALQNAVNGALKTSDLSSSIGTAVKDNLDGMPLDYNRLKQKDEILKALARIHSQPDGYKNGDEQLAERLAIEFEMKSR